MNQIVVQESSASQRIVLKIGDQCPPGLWTIQSAYFKVKDLTADRLLSYHEMKNVIKSIVLVRTGTVLSTVYPELFDAIDTFRVIGSRVKGGSSDVEFGLPIDFGHCPLDTHLLEFTKTDVADDMNLQITLILNLQASNPYQHKLMWDRARAGGNSQALIIREFKRIEYAGSDHIVFSDLPLREHVQLQLNEVAEDIYLTFSSPVVISNIDLLMNDKSLSGFFRVIERDGHYRLRLNDPLNFTVIDRIALVMDVAAVKFQSHPLPYVNMHAFTLVRAHCPLSRKEPNTSELLQV